MKVTLDKVPDPRPDRTNMTVMTKECFDYYFHTLSYRGALFKEKLGISQRIYNNTYSYFYTQEQRRQFGGERISYSQKRKNSNAQNAGVPRVKLDKDLLIKLLSEGRKVEWIANNLGVAPQTVFSNIEYYQIKLGDYNYCSFLRHDQLLCIKEMDKFFGTDLLLHHTEGEKRDVQAILDTAFSLHYQLHHMLATIAHIRKSTVGYATYHKIPFEENRLAGSKINYQFGKAFIGQGYAVQYEFSIGNKFYDIRIKDTNILIEIDSDCYHNKESDLLNDNFKTDLAKAHGYHLVRLATNKEKYPQIAKKVIECLQDLKSKKLLQ